MTPTPPDQSRGRLASSDEFSSYDQVAKPTYHLAEAADGSDAFDDTFEFTSCDLRRVLHGDESDRQAFSHELGTAMREIGFVIIEGHGVDPAIFTAADRSVEELFTRTSPVEKMRFRAQRHGAVSEGYFPIRETSEIHPDLVEGWVFGRRAFDLDADPDFDAGDFWPHAENELAFRPLVEAMTPLFVPIMQSVLSYLGCDPHLFDDRLERPNLGLRLNYYPPLGHEECERAAGRLLGHEDIDLFTLLPAPAVEGLQVLHRNGRWVRLDAPAGSIIMNTGDYLQRMSNDILPSTTHRVSPPRDRSLAGQSRVSTPLAAYLKPDDILTVLPGLPEPKYEPIRVVTFHTRTTAKFYGAEYAVESPTDEPAL